MTGDPHLHLLITRLLCLAARVTHRDRHDARQLVEDVLHAPEAATSERGGLRGGRLRRDDGKDRNRGERKERREKICSACSVCSAVNCCHAFAPTPTGQVTPVPPSPQ